MLKHVVMFKLKEFENVEKKQEKIQFLKSELEKLKDKISVIKTFEVGVNSIENPNAYDIVLISTFNCDGCLKTYIEAPEHKQFEELLKENVIQRAVVNFTY